MEDSGLQIVTLWGPTIGKFENINFEILDLPSPKGSKTRVYWGGVHIYIYIYICYPPLEILRFLDRTGVFGQTGGNK